MRHNIYFGEFRGDFWPSADQLNSFFFPPDGEKWIETGNDNWGIRLEGLAGTGSLPYARGRKDINLTMWGRPGLGVLLLYHKIGPPGFRDAYTSKGDMSRLKEIVWSLHDDPLPAGLFVPFPAAFLAVKEFMATEGQLPECIEWVRNADLPDGTFPDP